jgi:hypothetical protein
MIDGIDFDDDGYNDDYCPLVFAMLLVIKSKILRY